MLTYTANDFSVLAPSDVFYSFSQAFFGGDVHPASDGTANVSPEGVPQAQ